MSRTCAGGLPISSKCQILMRYGRYPFGFQLRKLPNEQEPQPEPELRPNLLSTLTATLLLIHWSSCCCSGSSLMRLSNGCLPSASRLSALACQMCQNSRVRLKLFACHSSDLYVSAACAGLFPYAYNASHSPFHSHSHSHSSPKTLSPPYHAHVSATLVTCVFITVLSLECPPQRLFFLFSLD